ncbi:LON peptidase substrate-binding domain-containing protein, partial [Bacillus safensis]|uniref:LON peptidase substrate-binding domain-containing protein n=2 Tax=Bacillaceae TaxID=186817 RepID=UPI00398FDC8C
NGTIRVLVEGLNRAQIESYVELEDYTSVDIKELAEEDLKDAEAEALMRTLLDH